MSRRAALCLASMWAISCTRVDSTGSAIPDMTPDGGPADASAERDVVVPDGTDGTGGTDAWSADVSTERDAAADIADGPAPLTDADLHPTCLLSSESSLPGVHIELTSTRCVFTLAEARAGISIPYDVVIDADVPGFVPLSRYAYGSDVSGLDIGELLSGSGQSYCLCDKGLPFWVCPLDDGGTSPSGVGECAPVTLRQGVYHRTFTWDGVNWYGPSDTLNPKGAPFPAGDYTLAVSTAKGVLVGGGGTGTDGGDAGTDAASSPPLSAAMSVLVRLIP